MPPPTPTRYTTVAFSGAGHLLAYHLGVASTLLTASTNTPQPKLPPLRAVSGSSSGAIAAAVLSCLPHRLEEYADRFLQDRGHAFRTFQEMLLQEEPQDAACERQKPDLYVCVTKSHDGTPHLFHFPTNQINEPTPTTTSTTSNNQLLLRAIEASCRIPVSFHPLDMFQTASVSYEGEGVEINGTYYVDGGISGIFPPPIPMVGLDGVDRNLQASQHRLLVCPIEIGPLPPSSDNGHQTMTHVISPNYNNVNNKGSLSSIMMNSWSSLLQTRDGISIRRPFQNLQTLVVAGGFCSTGVLELWYQRGKDDAEHLVETATFD